jgi:hypothetical protein
MKKEARAAIEKELIGIQQAIRAKIQANKYAMRKLVEEQTTLKRQLAELQPLIRSLA